MDMDIDLQQYFIPYNTKHNIYTIDGHEHRLTTTLHII